MKKRHKIFSSKNKENISTEKQDSNINDDKSSEKVNISKESGDNALPAESEVKRTAGSFVAEIVFSVLLIAAICALRTVHLFANNVDEVTFAALGKTMWVFMGAGVAVFAILRIFLRKPYFAGTFVAFGTFLAVNFNWLADFMRLFFSKYYGAAIGGLVLFIVIVAGFFFLLRLLYKKKFPMHIIAKILTITFSCLVIFNVVLALIAIGKIEPDDTLEDVALETAAPAATVDASDEATQKPTAAATVAETPPQTPEAFGQPNIYYFILDEYGTFDIMSEYYGYNNGIFYDFLKTKGFNISRETYATDTQTEHSICDLLNLDYISRHLSKEDCIEYSSKAALYTILSNLGYSQFQISTNNKYINSIISLNSDAGAEAYEAINMFGDEGADEIISDNSISDAFGELFGGAGIDSIADVSADDLNDWGFYPSDYIRGTKAYKDHEYRRYINAVLKIFDYFEAPTSYAATMPRVTYSYMTATHVPFVFDEYGGIIPYEESRNWEDTNIYLNQYKFITKHMMATLSAIIENDPNSIIIIMSDHGIRYHADCNKKHTFYITDKDSCRIFNAVYVKGQQYDIEGLSGVNTLRKVLSLYEGLDFPPIEDPITSDSPDSLKGIIPKTR